jgi:hypothetical protein
MAYPNNIGYSIFTGNPTGFVSGVYMWLWVYIDPAGNYSNTKLTPMVTMGSNSHIVFNLMPSVYSGEIDRMEIYRSDKMVSVPKTNGIVSGTTYIVYDADNSDSASYNGNNYSNGETFVGVSPIDDWSGSADAVLEYPTSWGFIGKIESEDEGVFLDGYIELGKPFKSVGGEYNYESDIRWSEPYRPNHIRLENVASFRLGDGKQITGLAVLYGNLVVFKENSIGRYAVQASTVPISRVDEVSNEIGCIAPNTLIQIANTLYFLSWKGLMKYDNNQLSKVDNLFDEELQFRLRNAGLHEIRKASCGYNNTYNELYLNFPFTGVVDGNSSFAGETVSFTKDRLLHGHIYVVSLDKGYATKYAYTDYPLAGQLPNPDPDDGTVVPRNSFSHARIYHTNSLGELRSAETGEHYAVWASDPPSGTPAKIPAGIFIDAPTEVDEDWVIDVTKYIETDNTIQPNPDYEDYDGITIGNLWRSKHFTGDKEENIKRIRKVSMNRWQRTNNGTITVNSVPFDIQDDRIDEDGFITTGLYASGNNILTLIPQTVAGNDVTTDNVWLQDSYGKPIRFWVQYEGSSRTHLNAIQIWIDAINKYKP